MGLVIVVAIIILACFIMHNKKERKNNIKTLLVENNMTPSQEFQNDDATMYACIDTKDEKFLIANISSVETKKQIIDNFKATIVEEEYFKFFLYDNVRKKLLVANNKLKFDSNPIKDGNNQDEPFTKVLDKIDITKYEFLRNSSDSCFYIFDEENKNITIGNISRGDIKQIGLNSIIKIDIIENNVTTIEKNIGNAIGKSIIGGTIAGNTGAIIGGMSSNSSINVIPEKMSIKFYIKDTTIPSYSLQILDSHLCTKSSKKEYANSAKTFAQNICDTIESYKVIQEEAEPVNNGTSNLEGLMKLAKLKEQGFLTEEEFQKEKEKLLN